MNILRYFFPRKFYFQGFQDDQLSFLLNQLYKNNTKEKFESGVLVKSELRQDLYEIKSQQNRKSSKKVVILSSALQQYDYEKLMMLLEDQGFQTYLQFSGQLHDEHIDNLHSLFPIDNTVMCSFSLNCNIIQNFEHKQIYINPIEDPIYYFKSISPLVNQKLLQNYLSAQYKYLKFNQEQETVKFIKNCYSTSIQEIIATSNPIKVQRPTIYTSEPILKSKFPYIYSPHYLSKIINYIITNNKF